MIIKRHLGKIAFQNVFGRQMRFIVGPRQAGKTTLAKEFLSKAGSSEFYYNWDLRNIRDKFRSNPNFFWEELLQAKKRKRQKPWVCFDEIHKIPKWKNILKGIFDEYEKTFRFIATFSARLDLMRRSGDSLVGRYFSFKLFPVVLSELKGCSFPDKSVNNAENFIHRRISYNINCNDEFEQLFKFGGFPEPLIKASDRFHRRWQKDYIERLIFGDIRDLMSIRELENVAVLIKLLPERIGSPLSLNSLRETMEVSYNAIKTWIKALEFVYVIFLVPPYHLKLAASLKKEKKLYFFDWSRADDESVRFENYVAVELKTMIELWNDSGAGNFALFYVKQRNGRETDFLIVREKTPWLLIEAKLTDENIESQHFSHSQRLGGIPFVQILKKAGVVKKVKNNFFVVSAERFFSGERKINFR